MDYLPPMLPLTKTHPLHGKRIVITRGEGQNAELVNRLAECGAIPIVFPTIQIVPQDDYGDLDRALTNLASYDWVIFTSINGVKHVLARMTTLDLPFVALNALKVAAVGSSTDEVLRQAGIQTTLRPDEYVAEALVETLAAYGDLASQRFLLLRVDIARAILREQLLEMGAQVDEVHVYRTVLGNPDPSVYEELRRGVDMITFTSSSTVKNFFQLLGDDALPIAQQAKIACIGPITANTARDLGLTVAITASVYTMSGLLDALIAIATK